MIVDFQSFLLEYFSKNFFFCVYSGLPQNEVEVCNNYFKNNPHEYIAPNELYYTSPPNNPYYSLPNIPYFPSPNLPSPSNLPYMSPPPPPASFITRPPSKSTINDAPTLNTNTNTNNASAIVQSDEDMMDRICIAFNFNNKKRKDINHYGFGSNLMVYQEMKMLVLMDNKGLRKKMNGYNSNELRDICARLNKIKLGSRIVMVNQLIPKFKNLTRQFFM